MAASSIINYLHIPKTAGSTILKIFKRQYTKSAFFLPGTNPNPASVSYDKVINDGTKLVFGHMDFGLHENVNANIRYVTTFRHPYKRVLSHYSFAKRQEQHYLYEELNLNNMSLADYIQSGLTNEMDNGQVRMLTGAGGFHKNMFTKYDIGFGECKPWLLEEAKKNIIEYFEFCGIQESFDESLIMMSNILKWKRHIGYASRNISKKKLTFDDLDNDTKNILIKYNDLDMQLYSWIKSSFKNLLKENSSLISSEMKRLKKHKRMEDLKYSVKQKLFHALK